MYLYEKCLCLCVQIYADLLNNFIKGYLQKDNGIREIQGVHFDNLINLM